MSDKLLKRDRSRSWRFVLYGFDVLELEMDLIKLVQNHFITNYAFIEHKRDIYDEDDYKRDVENKRETQEIGTLKISHIHLLCIFYQPVSRNVIINRFIIQDLEKGKTVLCNQMRDRYTMFRYLMHKDNPEKVQYNENEIHCYKMGIFTSKLETTSNMSILVMFEDYIRGESYYNMMVKYGRDWIINHEKYIEYFNKIGDLDA